MREYIIVALPENGNRAHMATFPQKGYNLPDGTEVITKVVEPDRNIVSSWAKRSVIHNSSIAAMKAECAQGGE